MCKHYLKCLICGLKEERENKKVKFFRFPKDSSRKEIWLKKLNRLDIKNKKVSDDFRICEKHFNKHIFTKTRTLLKKNATPIQIKKKGIIILENKILVPAKNIKETDIYDTDALPDMEMEIPTSSKYISAIFPMGPDASEMFCRYEIIAGKDWEHVSGLKNGISQSTISRRGCQEITLNMPIEFVYKSTNPFGWPQIVICVYGKNFWGVETSLGYASVHAPIFGHQQTLTIPILIPRCSNFFADLSSWISGKNPELKNPEVIAQGIKTKGLLVESYGELVLSLQTISRSSNRMGYDSGTTD